MGEHIEWATARAESGWLVDKGESLGDRGLTVTHDHALVVGSLAIEGTRHELSDMLDRLRGEVETIYVAEHENALHNAEPEPRCPVCRSNTDDELREKLATLANEWEASSEEAHERAGDEPDRVDEIEDSMLGEVLADSARAIRDLLDAPLSCRHCGRQIEPDDQNGYVHSDDGVVGCGIGTDGRDYGEAGGEYVAEREVRS